MKKKIFYSSIALLLFIGIIALYLYIKNHSLPSNTEEVFFKSGDITLHGYLLKPENLNQTPAIIIMHGAGEGKADDGFYTIHAKTFRDNGFTVLIYDKRGCGKSGGDFFYTSYSDLVQDGIAAINFLKFRNGIDTNSIGLFGSSESGWLTPEIASTTKDVAFIINRCGSPLSWVETNLFEVRNELIDQGVPENNLSQILKVREEVWNYYIEEMEDTTSLMTERRNLLNEKLATIRSEYDLLDETLPQRLPEYSSRLYKILAHDFAYDPEPYYAELEISVLAIFAGEDVNTPPDESIKKIEDFNRIYDKNFSTKLFEGVGHSLMTWRGFLNGGYIPGYFELITDSANSYIKN